MKTQTRKQRKKRTRWPWVVMILIMILVIAAAAHSMMRQASNTDSSAAQSSSVSQAHPAPAPESESEPEPTATPVPTATLEPELATDRPITTEEAAEMDALLDSMPGSISVWIQDIGSGQTYTYKPDNGFYCASTLKAPYALWLCQRDEDGLIDLDAAVGSGSGWDLIYPMIAHSSNGAAHDLGAMWPGSLDTGFSDFLTELGFASPEGCEVVEEGIHGWVTGADGGRAMRALYDYFETGTENALELQEAFLAADHDLLYCPAPAAKKYGSWDQALHDMAIVYAERPYIISMFTDWGDQEVSFPEEGRERMQQVGQLAAEIILND
ncbi:serine hydrolase [Allofournierella massiliensis]|uniref:Beta-lactamase family protein n=1 Tax=Allofournierella massiliensis TaxID=1650663 RepID=A0A4R1QUT3_9FIRM|nr:serine hydrolase [Fournierella massiliensis]TCL57739.1 beta-lactamase family protein [Fournierella massiliensis]